MCECSADALVRTLAACNFISLMLGVCVFGLGLGTVKDDVFVLEKRTSLAPLYQMACADVATAVFMWILTIVGIFTLIYRTSTYHAAYISGVVLNLILQICAGIATLVVCAQKVEGWRKLSKAFCELNYTPDRIAYISQGGTLTGMNKGQSQTSDPNMQKILDFGDRSVFDCGQFNDLMTPAGALLIVGSFLYFLILPVAVCLYQEDKENPPVPHGKQGVRATPGIQMQQAERNL